MVRRFAPAGYVAAKAATPYTAEPVALECLGVRSLFGASFRPICRVRARKQSWSR